MSEISEGVNGDWILDRLRYNEVIRLVDFILCPVETRNTSELWRRITDSTLSRLSLSFLSHLLSVSCDLECYQRYAIVTPQCVGKPKLACTTTSSPILWTEDSSLVFIFPTRACLACQLSGSGAARASSSSWACSWSRVASPRAGSALI